MQLEWCQLVRYENRALRKPFDEAKVGTHCLCVCACVYACTTFRKYTLLLLSALILMVACISLVMSIQKNGCRF